MTDHEHLGPRSTCFLFEKLLRFTLEGIALRLGAVAAIPAIDFVAAVKNVDFSVYEHFHQQLLLGLKNHLESCLT